MTPDPRQKNLDRALVLLSAIIPGVSYYLTLPGSIDIGRSADFAISAFSFVDILPSAGTLWDLVSRLGGTIIPTEPTQALHIVSLLTIALSSLFLYLLTSRTIARISQGSHPGYAGGLIAALSFAWFDIVWSSATTVGPAGAGILFGLAGLTLVMRWYDGKRFNLWNLIPGVLLILVGGFITWPVFALLPLPVLLIWFRSNTGESDPLLRPRYIGAGVGTAIGILLLWFVVGAWFAGDLPETRVRASEIEGVVVSWSEEENRTDVDLVREIEEDRDVDFRGRVGRVYTTTLLRALVGRVSDHRQAPALLWSLSGEERARFMTAPDDENRFPIRYFALPLLLALIGLVHHFRRAWRSALAIVIAFIATGPLVALLASPAALAVDGLFALNLAFLALWMGVGAGGMAEGLRRLVEQDSDQEGKISEERVANLRRGALLIALLVGPVNLIYNGWNLHDRAGVTFAEDFAANMLVSCQENTLLFVEGSDLGSMLRYVQSAKDLRRDVDVVELESLHNQRYRWSIAGRDASLWRSEEGTPPSREGIEKMLAARIGFDSLEGRVLSVDVVEGRSDTILWSPAGVETETGGHYFTTAHRVLEELVIRNINRRPIAIAVTVDPLWWSGLDRFFVWSGLVYHIRPNGGGEEVPVAYGAYPIDREEMMGHLMSGAPDIRFKLEGLDNPDLHYRPQERALVPAYRRAWLALAASSASDSSGSKQEILREMDRQIPIEVFPMNYWTAAATALLIGEGEEMRGRDPVERYARHAIARADAMGEGWRTDPIARSYNPHQITARMLALLGDYDGAIARYRSLSRNPESDPVIRGLIEELRIERHLVTGDTTAALTELDRIIAGYSGATSGGLEVNRSAWQEYRKELGGE